MTGIAVNSVYENGKIKILFRDLTQTRFWPDSKRRYPVSIAINKNKCSQNADAASRVCPGNLIKADADGKAHIKRAEELLGLHTPASKEMQGRKP